MAIVSSLLNATAGVTNILQKGGSIISLASATAALVKPQDQVEGINGLLFSIPESESLRLQAQITDHVVENNSSMQDHIAINPISVTLTGKVSELVLSKSKLEKYAETVLNTLGTVGALSPAFSQSATQALSTISRAKQATEQTLAKLANLKDVVSGNPTRNKQQDYYLKLKQLFYGRSLMTIQTPWENLQNMAIENVSFDQDETTNEWTTVSVTLKQITLAQTKQLTEEIQGRIKVQKAPVVEKGLTRGKSIGATIVDAATENLQQYKQQILNFFGN